MNLIYLAEFFKTRNTLGDSIHRWEWFSLTHIMMLLVTVIFATVMSILYKKSDSKKRRILEWIVVGLMIAEEVQMFTISIATHQFEIGFLPLQLCGINIFFCIAHAIWHKDWMEDFLYGLAIPGALIALLVPTWRSAPVWNFIFIFSTGYHIFLITYPIMLLAGGMKPNYKNIWKVMVVVIVLCAIMFGINQFNGYMATKTGNTLFWSSNFMFTYKPESLFVTLQNLFHLTGYWYLITIPFALLLVMAIFYLPWIIIDLVSKKKTKNA